MTVEHDEVTGQVPLSQSTYIKAVVKQFGDEDIKSVDTPAKPIQLSSLYQEQFDPIQCSTKDHSTYRSLIGALMYCAMITRPDIAYIVGELSRYVAQPLESHLEAAKRVLKYLHGTADYKMIFGKHKSPDSPIHINIYADSDW